MEVVAGGGEVGVGVAVDGGDGAVQEDVIHNVGEGEEVQLNVQVDEVRTEEREGGEGGGRGQEWETLAKSFSGIDPICCMCLLMDPNF